MDQTPFSPRPVRPGDYPALRALCDACVGPGLYDEAALRRLVERPGSVCLVQDGGGGALAGYCLTYPAGAAETAALVKLEEDRLRGMVSAPAPRFGICKSLGVDAVWRHTGLARELQGACADALDGQGCDALLGVAWRQGGYIPVERVLLSLGFSYLCDTQKIWYDEEGLECPYCGEKRCVCPAAIFIKKRGDRP